MIAITVAVGIALLLGFDSAAAPPVRFDRYGDPLPPGAVARLGTTRLRHSGPVSDVRFSPGGKTILSLGQLGKDLAPMICEWDLASGKELRRFAIGGDWDWVKCRGISAAGALYVAKTTDGSLRPFDVATGKALPVLVHESVPLLWEVSEDGRLLACTTKSHLHVWDVVTGRRLRQWPVKGEVPLIAFSPDSKILAIANEGEDGQRSVQAWNVTTGEGIHRIKDTDNPIGFAFSPDSLLLAVRYASGGIRLRDVSKGQELHREKPRDEQEATRFQDLRFSPDGKMLATRYGQGTVHLLERATMKKLRQLEGSRSPQGDNPVFSWISFSPDGKILAAAGPDLPFFLFDVATGRELRKFGTERDRLPVAQDDRFPRFSPGGRWLIDGSEGDWDFRMWEVATGKEVRLSRPTSRAQPDLRFSPRDEHLATWHEDGTIVLWDMATGKPRADLPESLTEVLVIEFSPDGKTLVTGERDSTLRLWDATTGKQIWRQATSSGVRRFMDEPGGIVAACFSPDGKVLATVTFVDGDKDERYLLQLWDTAAGKIHWVQRIADCQKALAFSPDGKALLAGGNSLTLRDVKTGGLVWRGPPAGPLGWTSPGFSSDGKWLATASGRMIQVWDAATGKPLRRITHVPSEEGQTHIDTLAFQQDSRTLMAADGTGTICYWDVRSGEKTRQLTHQPHDSTIALGPFSSDLRTRAAFNHWPAWNPTIRLGEVVTGRGKRYYQGHTDRLLALTFSPDGRRLASSSKDGTVLVWDLTEGQLEAKPGGRAFTAAELDALWSDLGGVDAAWAHRAVWNLVSAPGQAVPFLRERLAPFLPKDAKRIRQLIAELNGERFAAREHASAELGKLIHQAEGFLRNTLTEQPPLEAQRRILELLKRFEADLRKEELRALRALHALEQIGTPEARQLLDELAKGAHESLVVQDARASRHRVDNQRKGR